MDSEKNKLDLVCDAIASSIGQEVQGAVEKAVRDSFRFALDSAALEGEFYRSVNNEMLHSLKSIYKDISGVPSSHAAGQTSQLFSDTSQRLEEVMSTTRKATDTIMEKVEELLAGQKKAGEIIAVMEVPSSEQASLAQLDAIIGEQEDKLTDILTACSFEDLTGQRLQRIMNAVDSIKETVFDLYLASGLMLKDKEEHPDKDTVTIMQESKIKAKEIKDSELKGPTVSASQGDVDDLLASLGL